MRWQEIRDTPTSSKSRKGVRPFALTLVGEEAREVAAIPEREQRVARRVGEAPIAVVGGPAQVRREHHVRQTRERMIGRQRLPIEHVEPGARDSPFRKRRDECALIYDWAAGRVD